MATPTPNEPDLYLTVKETCRRFAFSRSTFYRMLADPSSGLAAVIVRIPPESGRIRVPSRAFEGWLRRRRGRGDQHAA